MLVVVGGHSRSVGKTSVICRVISGLPEMNWTALKITQYGHGICSKGGEPCECTDRLHPVALSREDGGAPATDSGRFLAAGARRAFWLRTAGGELAEALPRLRKLLAEGGNFIIESNSLVQFLRPDLYVLVVDGKNGDFKPSSRRSLDRVDLVVDTSGAPWLWPDVPVALLERRPRLFAPAPLYENEALIAAVRERSEGNGPASP